MKSSSTTTYNENFALEK